MIKSKHEFKISDSEMRKVFKLPFKVLSDVKSQDFQYRSLTDASILTLS